MRYSVFIAFCLAVCLLAGTASAETRIVAPGGSFEGTIDLPVIISGVEAATGVGFGLSYDTDLLRIERISASAEIPGSNVVPRIDNEAGFAKVAVTNTQGISAPEPASLVVIRFTRVGPGGGTMVLQEPQWSDAQFMAFNFGIVENGSINPLQTPTSTTAIPSSGSEDPSSSSGAPTATPVAQSTMTPAVTTVTPEATTLPPISPEDTVEATPAASPGVTTEATYLPVTPQAAPGFCGVTICASGILAIALLFYRRS